MRTYIVPFTDDLAPAVAAFNERLAAGGIAWRFPESPEPDWLPPRDGAPAYQELFVLTEGDAVRGAYCLKHHEAVIDGTRHGVTSFHLPLSEGTIDPRYALVAMQLVRHALACQPRLFGVGMRGPQSPVARLLRALKWRIAPVPFYCRVLHGTRVARQIRYLRRHGTLRWLLDGAAATGLAAAGTRAARTLLVRRPDVAYEAETADAFGDWADAVWAEGAAAYSFCAVRDAAVLNVLYPPGAPGLVRVRVRAAGSDLGWAAVQAVPVADHEHFGDLRLGTVVDAFARPAHARAVTHAATRALEELGCELIVANQQHPVWCAALRAAGFVRAPSTVMFGAAPDLARLIGGADPSFHRVHLTRGDGDGPWGVSRGLA